MNKKLLIGFGGILLIVTIFFISDRYEKRLPTCLEIGDTTISVDVADTPQSQEQGLSGRSSLAENNGMLFLFPREGLYGFWMKDMNFPIDIVWLDADWRIVGITPYFTPSTYPEIKYPEVPVRAAVEVAAGFSDRHGIKTGDSVAVCPTYVVLSL